jgi:ABC-type branched-subunit amino acid transport system substrate-binding protein
MLGLAMFAASTVTAVGVATAGTAGAAAANKSTYLIGQAVWNTPTISPNTRYPGTNAAIRTINAAGGVNGHPIKLDQCLATDANSGVACASQFVKDGVIATVTDLNIIAEVAYTQAMAAAGIPEIDPYISTAPALSSPNVFLIDGGSAEIYASMAPYMKLKGYKTYNVIYGVSASANANIAIIDKAAAYYSLTKIGSTGIPLTSADYQPYVAQAAATKADANPFLGAPFMTNLLLGASESLAEPLVIGVSANQMSKAMLQKFGAPGGSLVNAMLPAALPPLSASKTYPGLLIPGKSIASYYKATKDPNAAPDVLTGFATMAWLDVYTFQKIAKTITGTVNAASMMTALNNAKNVNLLGVIKWTPSAQGPTGFARISNPYEYFSTVKNGQEVLFQKKPVNVMTPFK